MSKLSQRNVRPALATVFLGLLALLLTACGPSVPTTTGNAVNAANTVTDNASIAAEQKVNQLHLDDTGYAHLTWDQLTHVLTVTLNLTGLPANTTHPAHIHLGNCSMMGNILYTLNNVVADSHGNYVGTTVIPNVKNGVPASGWYINVHHGPGLATADQMAPITCGNILNSSPKPDHAELIQVQLNSLFINQFTTVNKISSTVPSNGDVNPYGVAVVQQSTGKLVKGDVLVSNFNNRTNLQGTGTTIVQIAPDGKQSLFAQLPSNTCAGKLGLTTGLVELKRGWVIVGSMPTLDGTAATLQSGCLIVLNNKGQVATTLKINGPWDASAQEDKDGDQAVLFASNFAHTANQSTVVRFDLQVPDQGKGTLHIASTTVIGTNIASRTDPAALVLGPTGVGLGLDGKLYIADTLNNTIMAIPNALTRGDAVSVGKYVIASGGSLNGPLGLTIAPNGDILTVNGNDGNLVETTPAGVQIAVKQISNEGNPVGAGCLFGLAVVSAGNGLYFGDDCTNQLNLFH